MNNTQVIIGPPGTGKTTFLLNLLEEKLAKGYSPEQIAFVSFTRKASHEARDRALEKFSHLNRKSFRWFRTIHSVAFQCSNMVKEEVFGRGHCIELGKLTGNYISGSTMIREEGALNSGSTKGDELLFIYNLSKVMCKPLNQVWKQFSSDRIRWIEMDYFAQTYDQYKKEWSLFDFTDMIQLFLDEGVPPPIKILFVDEAQDLSQIQWRMVHKLAEGVDEVYIAGDDDQAIYAWSGADVEYFVDLKAPKTVLNRSYRLPSNIYNFSNKISSNIRHRNQKEWTFNKQGGTVNHILSLPEAPLKEGNWMILLRNNCYIENFVDFLTQQGYSFSSRINSPIENEAVTAIKNWEILRKGERLSVGSIRPVYNYLKSGSGVARGYKMLRGVPDDRRLNLAELQTYHGLQRTDPWTEALEKVPANLKEYYLTLIKNDESLLKPRIFVGTIHSVKGGEADNVLMYPDMTYRTYKGYEQEPDNEHRVFYVGATRAKQNLYIMEPESQWFYGGLYQRS